MKSQYEDKVIFVLTLLSIIFVITSFKAQFENIIIDFGFISVNLLTLFNTTLILILISVYLYALDYVRYGVLLLEDLSIFKYIQNIAHLFYAIAIFTPILYILCWLIVKVIRLIPLSPLHYPQFVNYSSLIISMITILFSIFSFLKHTKDIRIAQEERLDESISNSTTETRKLFENQMWRASIIEAYRSLEISMRKKLLELGIDAQRIPFFHSTEILVRREIISKEDYNVLEHIRELRNKAVHSSFEFSRDDAKNVIEASEKITPKLGTITTSHFLFEREILRLLVDSKKGLFLRHHFFLNVKNRDSVYDAWAEGPEHEYLIEIKATSNPSFIRSTLKKLRDIARPNKRIIIVLLTPSSTIEFDESDARLLFYNPEKREFKNRQDVYNWIYKESK